MRQLCGAAGRGYCSACGQRAVNLHRPFFDLLSDAVGDLFDLDTRLARTIRPLMLTPGQVAKDYIAGRRASHVPPLKSYLIAALIFFGLFTIFPSRTPVQVFVQGSAAETAARQQTGSGRVSFSLPPSVPIYDEWYQAALARAMRQPEAFARAFYANVPRAFFVFLPLFALCLELLYRRQGYLVDHLVFSLYYHAFVFLMFSLVFLVRQFGGPLLPGVARALIALALFGWLFACLPVALRRVYGGSRLVTGAKLAGLGAMYAFVFASAMPLTIGAALLQF